MEGECAQNQRSYRHESKEKCFCRCLPKPPESLKNHCDHDRLDSIECTCYCRQLTAMYVHPGKARNTRLWELRLQTFVWSGSTQVPLCLGSPKHNRIAS